MSMPKPMTMTTTRPAIATATALLLGLAGCNGDGDDTSATVGGTGTASDATSASSSPTTTSPTTGNTTNASETSTASAGSSGSTGGSTTGATEGTTTDTSNTQGTSGTDTGAGVLDIEPKDAVIEVIDGVVNPQPYTVTYDGVDVTDQATLAYDKPAIGQIMLQALVPTGEVAGVGKISATYNGAEASTDATVIIKKTLDPDGLAGDFDAPPGGADPSMAIVYPYDLTVFPLNVAAPEVQWNGVQNGDMYKMTLKEMFVEYTVYFSTNVPARHLISEADWKTIAESGQGAKSDPLAFTLQRKSGGNLYQEVTQTWRIAQARLPGRVYYWELPDQCGNGNGRVLSIKPSEAQAEQFYNNGGCWGCHSVSRDGRTVSVVFDSGSPFPLATIDVSVEPAVLGPIAPQPGRGGTFSAFNHDGTKLVISNNGGSENAPVSNLVIYDTANGQVLNPDVMGQGCGEPAWSPDGKLMAATCNYTNGFWTFDASQADLMIADVNPDGISVSNKKVLVPQAGEVGRPAYPNFSPGNEWVVFGRPTSGSRSTGNGALWMVGVDGQNLKKLSIASSDNRSFNPTFAPLRAGGYYWVVFMTRRDYGNTLVGTNRQQLWITAISDPPTELDDPSNPPFYIRGQEGCAKSENAYFAPDPCIEELNKPCESGIDCCSGHCVQMGEIKVCGEKGECSEDGNACETNADCCNANSPCVDGYCQELFPG
ncbi:MAG: hypothetical protein KC420_04450 [Myxococcales bacterium]|nr:hypothetical protein [Myxococcales bacterium]